MPAASKRLERRNWLSTYLDRNKKIVIERKKGKKTIHCKTALHTGTALEHKIKGKLAGKLDESVIACFRDDEDVLDVGLDAGTALQKDQMGGYWGEEGFAPSCLLISRTPTAVSASCFVRLPTNSSSPSLSGERCCRRLAKRGLFGNGG